MSDDEEYYDAEEDAFPIVVDFVIEHNGKPSTYELTYSNGYFLYRAQGEEAWASMPAEVLEDAIAVTLESTGEVVQEMASDAAAAHGRATFGSFAFAEHPKGRAALALIGGPWSDRLTELASAGKQLYDDPSGATRAAIKKGNDISNWVILGLLEGEYIDRRLYDKLVPYLGTFGGLTTLTTAVQTALRLLRLMRSGNACETLINVTLLSTAAFALYTYGGATSKILAFATKVETNANIVTELASAGRDRELACRGVVRSDDQETSAVDPGALFYAGLQAGLKHTGFLPETHCDKETRNVEAAKENATRVSKKVMDVALYALNQATMLLPAAISSRGKRVFTLGPNAYKYIRGSACEYLQVKGERAKTAAHEFFKRRVSAPPALAAKEATPPKTPFQMRLEAARALNRENGESSSSDEEDDDAAPFVSAPPKTPFQLRLEAARALQRANGESSSSDEEADEEAAPFVSAPPKTPFQIRLEAVRALKRANGESSSSDEDSE
jgi:hypothetical protein